MLRFLRSFTRFNKWYCSRCHYCWWWCCRLNACFLYYVAGPSFWSLCHDMSQEVSVWTKTKQKTIWAVSQHSHANSTSTNRSTQTRKYVCKCYSRFLCNELRRKRTYKFSFISCYRRELALLGKPKRQRVCVWMKGLIRTMAAQVRFYPWYISLPSPAN